MRRLFVYICLACWVVVSYELFGLAGLIPSIILYLAIGYIDGMRLIARSRIVVKGFQNFAYIDVKCPYCTAGAQILGEDGWMKIPVHIRRVQDGSKEFHPPYANVRNCPECGGNGFKPVKIIPGHSERAPIVWPSPDGSLISSEKIHEEED